MRIRHALLMAILIGGCSAPPGQVVSEKEGLLAEQSSQQNVNGRESIDEAKVRAVIDENFSGSRFDELTIEQHDAAWIRQNTDLEEPGLPRDETQIWVVRMKGDITYAWAEGAPEADGTPTKAKFKTGTVLVSDENGMIVKVKLDP